ncbi:hypothetical protein FOZ62_025559, partial [Perkinsus olseni]
MSSTSSRDRSEEAFPLPSVQPPIVGPPTRDFPSLCRSMGSEQPQEAEQAQSRLEQCVLGGPSQSGCDGGLYVGPVMILNPGKQLASSWSLHGFFYVAPIRLRKSVRCSCMGLSWREEPTKDPIVASSLASFCYVACYTPQGSLRQSLRPLSSIYLTSLKLMRTYAPGLLAPGFTDDPLNVPFERLVRFHDPILWWHVAQGGTTPWTLGESRDFLPSLFAGPLSRQGHPEICQAIWSRLARDWDVVDAVFFALAWVLRHSEELRKIEDVRTRGGAVLSLGSTSEVDEIFEASASLKAFTPKSVLRSLQRTICDGQGPSVKDWSPSVPCLLVGPDDALAASDGLNTGQLCVLVDVRAPRARALQPSLRGSMEFDLESAGSAQIATFVNRAIATQRTYAGRELPDGKRGC